MGHHPAMQAASPTPTIVTQPTPAAKPSKKQAGGYFSNAVLPNAPLNTTGARSTFLGGVS